MKTTSYFIAIVTLICLFACTANKYVLSDTDLSDNKVVVLGVVEYDYSQLENKTLNGLNLFLDSKEKNMAIQLPKSILKNNRQIQQQFLGSVGYYGTYMVADRPNESSIQSDYVLALMNSDNYQESFKQVIREYGINAGKIVNIGKLTVKYKGGMIFDGRIIYSYSIQTDRNDTLALHAFRKTNPELFRKYANEVFTYNDEK